MDFRGNFYSSKHCKVLFEFLFGLRGNRVFLSLKIQFLGVDGGSLPASSQIWAWCLSQYFLGR